MAHVHLALDELFEHRKNLAVVVGLWADVPEEVDGQLVHDAELDGWFGLHCLLDDIVDVWLRLLEVAKTLVQDNEHAHEAVDVLVTVQVVQVAVVGLVEDDILFLEDVAAERVLSPDLQSRVRFDVVGAGDTLAHVILGMRCVVRRRGTAGRSTASFEVFATSLAATLKDATEQISAVSLAGLRSWLVESGSGVIGVLVWRRVSELVLDLVVEPLSINAKELWNEVANEADQSWVIRGCIHLVGERQDEVGSIHDDIDVVQVELELRGGNNTVTSLSLALLLLVASLDLIDQSLGLELLLVVLLGVDSLVIEGFPEHLLSLIAPDLLPLTLSSLPLLMLLLQAVQKDWDDSVWTSIQLLDDLVALLATVKLHDDALVDSLALTAKPRWELHGLSVLVRHATQLQRNRFEKLDGATTSLDVEVVVMAFLFDLVKTLFMDVFAMGDEARVL